MHTQIWFRNPLLYIKECVELNEYNHAWDRGFAIKKRVDPGRYLELYAPASAEYRILMVGDQGTAELRRGHSLANPAAVYPTWDYQLDNIATLEEMMAKQLGPEPGFPPDETAVSGQEHRVVITNLPDGTAAITRRFLRTLADMSRDYPECIVHVHNLNSYKVAFGMGFDSVDLNPRIRAAYGEVELPNGNHVDWKIAAKTPQWVNVIGFHTLELAQPRMRCMFNMKSAQWAARHYGENFNFRMRRSEGLDAFVPTKSSMFRRIPVSVGDRLVCDACSLQDVCKYYRAGGVCTIPGTDTSKLAAMFKTNNADQILDGLGELIEMQIERVVEGRADEKLSDEGLDSEVGRAMARAFDAGVTLAKLLDPTRFSAAGKKDGPTKVLNAAGEEVEINPAQLVADMIKEMRAQGVKGEITPKMVEMLLVNTPAAKVLSSGP